MDEQEDPWNRWDVLTLLLMGVSRHFRLVSKFWATAAGGSQSKSAALDDRRRFHREASLDIERMTGERE